VEALTPETAAGRAAARLLAEKSALARAVTDALYAERPYLLERYGESGRARTLEDMHYNIEHLIPAVDLGEPTMWASYVRWLDSVLRARGVPTREIVRCLELVDSAVRAQFPSDEADVVSAMLRVGLDALPNEAAS
jgi:hypothetical protein